MLNKVPFIPWVYCQILFHCTSSYKVYCSFYQFVTLHSSITLTKEDEKFLYGYAPQTAFIKILMSVTIANAFLVDSNYIKT
jgi:hypothetical protein